MKKLIPMLLCAIMFAGTASAQLITMKGANNLAVDTITVAGGTKYMTSASGVLNTIGKAGRYDIQATVTNDSGAATGFMVLQSTLNGTNWTNHYMRAGTDGIVCDSVGVSGTKTHIWHVEPDAVYRETTNATSTNSGRRLQFRVLFYLAATGRNRISSGLITSE